MPSFACVRKQVFHNKNISCRQRIQRIRCATNGTFDSAKIVEHSKTEARVLQSEEALSLENFSMFAT